ncbi:MAG TPA: YqaA family protein [Aquabacterium sp.]|nr:YqaA family protein [Aquabacterium sp.]
MTHWFETAIAGLLALLSIPQWGLGALFLISFVSATLVPMGSEPAVFGLIKLRPDLFWAAIAVATLGNTLGGAVTWWMGRAAHSAAEAWRAHHPPHHPQTRAHLTASRWLGRFGPPACLLSWLPVVGDPLCAVAGWLRLPFWPCVIYMAIGKLGRYLFMTVTLLWVTA